MKQQSVASRQASTSPAPVSYALRRLGENVSTARRMRRMTQQDLAIRIGASTATVRRIEEGHPGTALHTLLRTMHVLGRLDDMMAATALERDPLGLRLAQDQLPQRVRVQRTKIVPPKTSPQGAGVHEAATPYATGADDELVGF